VLSSSSINLGNIVILSGEISPIHDYVNVELYISENGYQWNLLATVTTNAQGHYAYQWTPTSTGTYYLKAHWSGDADHIEDESNISILQVTYSPTNPDDQGTPNPPSPPSPDNQGSESYIPIYLTIVLVAASIVGICLSLIWRKR
jgi:hypothetical protein